MIEKNYKIILLFLFIIQSSLFSQITNDTLVLNLFKAHFLTQELQKLFQSNSIEKLESLPKIYPSDSITYNIEIKKIDNESINFDCNVYLGYYSIKIKGISTISTGKKIYEPLIINKTGFFYFINKQSDLLKFIQNEVDLSKDDNIINLVKLLYKLDFNQLNEKLIQYEDTILDGEKDFINNKYRFKIKIERKDGKVIVKYHTLYTSHYSLDTFEYFNTLELLKNDIILKKEIINKF